jgi:ABC-type multidrug transport system ATPase subunit
MLVIAGLIEPASGRIQIGGQDVHRLPAAALARLITYVGSPAQVFRGSIADNLLYGLKQRPVADPAAVGDTVERLARETREAERSGNSPHLVEADWADFAAIGVPVEERLAAMIRALRLVGLEPDIYAMGLRSTLPPGAAPEVVERVLAARRAVEARLGEDARLVRLVERFDPERYNTNASLAENLLFGTPVDGTFDPENLSGHPYVVAILRATGLEDDLKSVGLDLARTMVELFADLPPDHEYFRQFSFIRAEDLPDYRSLVGRADPARLDLLSAADQERLLALPFKLVAARHRLGLITPELQDRVLEARRQFRAGLPADLAGAIDFFEPERFNAASSLQENILFGKVVYGQAQAARRIGALVDGVVEEVGLQEAITEVGLGSECGPGGSRLTPPQRQKLALARAALKRPAVLVLDDATALLDPSEQTEVRDGLLDAFADRTVIWSIANETWAERFTIVLALDQGRVTVSGAGKAAAGDVTAGREEAEVT